MNLEALRLLSFRAHTESRIEPAPKVNLLTGPNGAGKTNVLEAIHYLCLTKSFLASSDQYVLRKGSGFFEVEGRFAGTHRTDLRVRLVYVPETGKGVFVNRAPIERFSDLVGQVPVVVFAPSDHALTAEGPEGRRRFLDNILSQARPVYLDDLLKYRRALRQRNVLLTQGRRNRGRLQADVLASWDAELVALGSRVVAGRLRFMQAFHGYLEAAYQQIEAVGERPTFAYEGFADLDPEADESAVAEVFRACLDRVARREREMGRTLIGPHRDELVFRLNGLEVRRYASQGQHRTFGMALKLAQFLYLRENLGETPILLLDDIFGNLDPTRTRVFLDLLQSDAVGQSFITAASPAPYTEALAFTGDPHRAFHVEDGRIEAGGAD